MNSHDDRDSHRAMMCLLCTLSGAITTALIALMILAR
jgi:hypothetical protein